MSEATVRASINDDDVRLWSWGVNTYGQLGTNDIANRSVPGYVYSGNSNWKVLGKGLAEHNFAAIKTDGTLWTWGLNHNGQLGDGTRTSRSTPTQIIVEDPAGIGRILDTWEKVSVGGGHAAAIKKDGTLWSWGYNTDGRLGDNSITHRSSPVQTVAGGTNWSAVSCGGYHTAAIKTDGTLWMWGRNSYGELGDNSITHRSSPVQTIAGGTNWSQVSIGFYHTAAIKTDGTLWTWGGNTWGYLGTNDRTHRSSPVQTVAGGTNWSAVSCGGYYTAAIKTDGTLWMWGRNSNGELGDNSITHRSSPVQTIAGGTDWKLVSGGWYSAAGIKTDGTLWTWGNNGTGTLGDNSRTHRSSPVQISTGGRYWKDVVLGGQTLSEGSMIAAEDYYNQYGTKYTVGGDALFVIGGGKLGSQRDAAGRGTGGTGSSYSLDKVLGDPLNWVSIDAGSRITAGIKTDGTLWMWGRDDSAAQPTSRGAMGDGASEFRFSPVKVIGSGTWKQVSTGLYFHVSAIKTDGTLWTWGGNEYGQLGDNTRTHRSSPVQTVAGGTNWKQASSGAFHSGAVKTDGTLWMWGLNTYFSQITSGGMLGDNTRTHRSSPVQTVAGGTNWKMISCGGYHTAAIKTDGTLWTWGVNTYYGAADGRGGQLGDNSRTHRSSPVQVAGGGTNWKLVSSGSYTTHAVKTDGTLWSWGAQFPGDPTLGDGTTLHRSSPVQVAGGGTNWNLVQSTNYGAVAQKTDGTYWAWGGNDYGQLLDGTRMHRSSPVQMIMRDNWILAANNLVDDGTSTRSGGGDKLFIIKKNYKEDLAADSYVTKDYLNEVYPSLTSPFKSAGLWIWGYNTTGQIGDGTITHRSSPVQTIAGGKNWKKVSLGGDDGPIGLKTDGTLWGWGKNGAGAIGDNTTVHRSSPVLIASGTSYWTQLDSGWDHRLVLKDDGTLWVWGDNWAGQLGIGSLLDRSSAVQTLAGGAIWKNIAAGGGTSYAIRQDGTLWAWGYNAYGQLGDGTRTNRSSPVLIASGAAAWNKLSAGTYTIASIKTDGTLWMWGINSSDGGPSGGGNKAYGVLGDGTILHRSSPVQTVAGGTNWKFVSTSGYHTGAVKTDGTLWMWGINTVGGLGTNDRVHRSSPIQTIAGGYDWKLVSAGYYNTSAIKTDGTLWTWGMNNQGQLGTNDITHRSSPVQTISGGTNWKQLVKSYYGMSAIRDDSDDPI